LLFLDKKRRGGYLLFPIPKINMARRKENDTIDMKTSKLDSSGGVF